MSVASCAPRSASSSPWVSPRAPSAAMLRAIYTLTGDRFLFPVPSNTAADSTLMKSSYPATSGSSAAGATAVGSL